MSDPRANLRTPWKPGETGNPKGINQWTYRREAEQHLENWCKKHGQELVEKIANEAKAGKPWAAKLVLDRVLPVVMKHQVDLPSGSSIHVETEPERLDEVAEILGEAKALH